MFEKVLKVFTALCGVYLLFLVSFAVFQQVKPAQPVVGSVAIGSEYHATTTLSGTAAGDYVVTTRPTTLGSIVIASSSASTFTVINYDGVSTTVSSTIATMKASAAENTYTFDTFLPAGLTIRLPSGFTGQFITTYR